MTGPRLAADLIVSCIVIAAVLASLFIPEIWRTLKSLAAGALSIVLGMGYDLYLLVCHVLARLRRGSQ